jgi:hypothetical protein
MGRRRERPGTVSCTERQPQAAVQLCGADSSGARRGIHNYRRMLWGKKILEWSRTPQEAARIMIHLNNNYGVDGRIPIAEYSGYWDGRTGPGDRNGLYLGPFDP